VSVSLSRAVAAEAVGTALLVATVIGSGVMAERLAGGNDAIALLGNTLATGAMLVVLILMLGPLSGAHFNPAVSLVFALRRELPSRRLAPYVAAQFAGAVAGAALAHAMFELPLLQTSTNVRTGPAQWLSEFIATFGLVGAILCTLRARAPAVPYAVGFYISAAYWFTASTSFANPAVTLARSLTDTFSGIQPRNVPAFVAAQGIGAVAALAFFGWLLAGDNQRPYWTLLKRPSERSTNSPPRAAVSHLSVDDR
jgi:glycerol uptake facilitator-like aquaporin